METHPSIDIPRIREVRAEAHYRLGKEWYDLAIAESSETALTYAAFELRLALEWLAFELYYRVLGENFTGDDFRIGRRVKNIQQRIREIEGHQPKLNRKVRFCQLLFATVGIPDFKPVASVNLSELHRFWMLTSDYCHILPDDGRAFGDDKGFNDIADQLQDVIDFIDPLQKGMIIWPQYHNWLKELYEQYADGELDDKDVAAQIRAEGVNIEFEGNDGTRIKYEQN